MLYTKTLGARRCESCGEKTTYIVRREEKVVRRYAVESRLSRGKGADPAGPPPALAQRSS